MWVKGERKVKEQRSKKDRKIKMEWEDKINEKVIKQNKPKTIKHEKK